MRTNEALTRAVEAIAPRFRSGNAVPVDKAMVPAAEWNALVAALASAPPAAEPVGWCLYLYGEYHFFTTKGKAILAKSAALLGLGGCRYESDHEPEAVYLGSQPAEPAQPATQAGAVINGRPATAESILAALVDIDDDARQNAPEDRCYVESAWSDAMKLARHFVAQPTEQPSQDANPPR